MFCPPVFCPGQFAGWGFLTFGGAVEQDLRRLLGCNYSNIGSSLNKIELVDQKGCQIG